MGTMMTRHTVVERMPLECEARSVPCIAQEVIPACMHRTSTHKVENEQFWNACIRTGMIDGITRFRGPCRLSRISSMVPAPWRRRVADFQGGGGVPEQEQSSGPTLQPEAQPGHGFLLPVPVETRQKQCRTPTAHHWPAPPRLHLLLFPHILQHPPVYQSS
jgi:hypothetical protein